MGGPGPADPSGGLDEVLAHFGVKGMKWGVRRSNPSAPPSADSKRASETKARIKRGDTSRLSNKELQDLVTRMNLEQQYSQMTFKSAKQRRETNKFIVETLIEIGKNPAVRAGATKAAKVVASVLLKR